MRKLKVGIVGVGMAFEKLHYPEYEKMTDRYQISALCDVNPEKTSKWANKLGIVPEDTFTDWRNMLRARTDLDVIDIMVPISLNFEVTEGVARTLAGQKKGIICEKPLAATLKEAVAAKQLPKRYNIPILIAENFRYNDEFQIIRNLIQQKKIGDVLYFVQNRVVDFPGDMLKDRFPAVEWRQKRDFRGGALADTGVHDIAALQHIFGAISKVQAFGRPLATEDLDWAPYSVVQANLLFDSGLTGSFSFFCQGREMQRPLMGLRIFGTNGMIFLEERDCGFVNVALNDGSSEQIPYKVQAGYYNELANFYNALTGTEPISVTPEMEFGDVRVIHMMLKSIADGRIVSVDDTESIEPLPQQMLDPTATNQRTRIPGELIH